MLNFARTRKAGSILIVSLLSGCAVSSANFYNDRYSLSNPQLCRTLQSSQTIKDPNFLRDVRNEIDRRGLSDDECVTIVRNQSAAIGAGLLVGIAVVAAARKGGGGGGGGGSGGGTAYDFDWEWDQHYGSNRQLVWSCRGVQTGQFAALSNCASKFQNDWKWPGK